MCFLAGVITVEVVVCKNKTAEVSRHISYKQAEVSRRHLVDQESDDTYTCLEE